MVSRKRVMLCALFTLALAGTPALAQESGSREEARALFEEGVALLDEHAYAQAAQRLERSIAIREAPAALYNLGLAYRGTGSTRRAIEVFRRFLALAGERADLAGDAARMLGELERSLARVTLEWNGVSDELLLNGEPVAVESRRRATLEVDPGRAVFELRRDGYEPARREVVLDPGSSISISFDDRPITPSSDGSSDTAAIALLASGGALAVAGGVFVALGIADYIAVEESQGEFFYDSVSDEYDRAPIFQAAGIAGAATGLALVTAAIILLAASGEDAEHALTRPAVAF